MNDRGDSEAREFSGADPETAAEVLLGREDRQVERVERAPEDGVRPFLAEPGYEPLLELWAQSLELGGREPAVPVDPRVQFP